MGDLTATATGATGLGLPATRWALALVWLLGVAWGAVGGSFDSPGLGVLLPYVTLAVGGFLLTEPGDRPLGMLRALGVAACSLTSVALVLATLNVVGDSWLASLGYYLVALLIARGNVVVGGVGVSVTLAVGLGWGVASGGSAGAVLEMLAVPVMAAIAGVVWQLTLRRVVSLEQGHRSDAARAVREAQISVESAEANRKELTEIRTAVEPLLTLIANGVPVDLIRRDLEVIEGAIRDRIRVPALQSPALNDAIAGCRGRGAHVVLLGERDSAEVEAGLLDALMVLIHEVDRGRVTVRLVPPGRGSGASVVFEEEGALRRVVLAQNGSITAQF